MKSTGTSTIEAYCLARLKARQPLLPFPFANPKAHASWARQLRAALWRELGDMPGKVPLRPRVTERRDMGEYVREKVVLQTGRYMSMPAWVLIPKSSPLKSPKGKLPVILAAHGHGFGKDPTVGETHGRQEIADRMKRLNDDYAHQAALRGYLVIAPEWRPFGERSEAADWVRPHRDGCDVANNAAMYFGHHLLGLNIWDGMRAIDYAAGRPEADPRRVGCLGLSYGGTMTTYLTALDRRIKVACISGYVSTLENAMGHRRANFCGAQQMPGLAKYGDIPDVVLLAAPRPLCIERGLQENTFYAPDMLKAVRYVQRGYQALGAADRLMVDAFEGKHEWSGRKSWSWFERWLG